jgi:hypothetical protein
MADGQRTLIPAAKLTAEPARAPDRFKARAYFRVKPESHGNEHLGDTLAIRRLVSLQSAQKFKALRFSATPWSLTLFNHGFRLIKFE